MSHTATTTFTDAKSGKTAETVDLAREMKRASARDEKMAAAMTDYKPVETTDVHITETPLTLWNWYKQVAWQNAISIFFLPFLGVLGTFWTSLRWETALLSVAYYFVSGSGIMAGTDSRGPRSDLDMLMLFDRLSPIVVPPLVFCNLSS